jgi:hypothetical protein
LAQNSIAATAPDDRKAEIKEGFMCCLQALFLMREGYQKPLESRNTPLIRRGAF